jgi:hypothetical protein
LVFKNEIVMANQKTLAHGHGMAALLRRLLADQQVSPTGLALVPMLIETAITFNYSRFFQS